jgi:3-dehydroquinate dehydratase/shikimate dehydrogenase
MMLIEIQEAAKRGAEFIEVRLDFLARAIDLKRILANKPCPFVATLRRQQDGGRWAGTEEQRRMLLRQAIVGGFDWVDLETDIAETIPRFRDVKRIVSYHNLKEMPADLEEIHAKMQAQDADVVKIAVRAEHPKDNLRVLDLIRKGPKPTVALCMGDMGVASRILGAKYGAPFTYAAFNKERGLAPGILSFEEMRKLYNYDAINADTRVFAVIGDPIEHSLSPLAHNAAFRKKGINGVYVPLRIPRSDLVESLKLLRRVPIEGYSVTIPHKESILDLAHDHDELSQKCRAANTLIPQEQGKFAAFNTDGAAALASLRNAMMDMEGGPVLSGRSTLILGAGGAARALAYTLKAEGALLTISNRTAARGVQLAQELDCRHVDWSGRNSVSTEVVINCTPIGMHPNLDETPLHHSALRPGLVVMDVVYNPETTLLVRQARERGCRVVTGVDMFVRQAAEQFRYFTGEDAPIDDMKRVVSRYLSPRLHRDEEAA